MKSTLTLKAAVITTATLASNLGFATLKLDNPIAQRQPAVYAAENTISPSGTVLEHGPSSSTADQRVEVSLGAGVEGNAYVRFDLTNGKFKEHPQLKTSDSSSYEVFGMVSGGGAGNSYVVFTLIPNRGTGFRSYGVATLFANGITVTNQQGVQISYQLHGSLSAANSGNPNGALKAIPSTPFVQFVPAIITTIESSPPVMADLAALKGGDSILAVPAPFSKFVDDPASIALGKVTIYPDPKLGSYSHPALANGQAMWLDSALATFLHSTDNEITIKGNFSWLIQGADKGQLYLADSAEAMTGIPAWTLNETQATFRVAPNQLTKNGKYILARRPNGSAIPASTYKTSVALKPPANSSGAITPGNTPPTLSGQIERNGMQMKFPTLSQGKGTITYLQLINSSASRAPFMTECYQGNGSKEAGLTDAIPADSTYRKTLTDLCPTNAGKTQSAIITLAAPSGSVNGTIMRKDATTGVLTYVNASMGNEVATPTEGSPSANSTLKFPALSQGQGTITYLQLINTSDKKATFTTRCYEGGNTRAAGLRSSIPADTTYRKTLAEICPSNASKTQSIIIDIAAPVGAVNGTVMRKATATGIMTYVNASSGNN